MGYVAVESITPQAPKWKRIMAASTTAAPRRSIKLRWPRTGSIDTFPLSMSSSKNVDEKRTTTPALTVSGSAPDTTAYLTTGPWTTVNFVLQVQEIGSRLQQLSKLQVQEHVSKAIKHALRHEAQVATSASIVQFAPVLLLQLG